MKLNPTPREVILLVQRCLLMCLHAQDYQNVKGWWRAWRKQRRGPRQRRARDPSASPQGVGEVVWLERKP